MRRRLACLAAGLLLAVAPVTAFGRGGSHSGSTTRASSSYSAPSASSTAGHHRQTYSSLAERDDKGRIARSANARDAFKRGLRAPRPARAMGLALAT